MHRIYTEIGIEMGIGFSCGIGFRSPFNSGILCGAMQAGMQLAARRAIVNQKSRHIFGVAQGRA